MSVLAKFQQLPECPVNDETLHMAFVGAYNQLALMGKRLKLDDLDQRVLDNCISSLEQIQSDFALRLNHETDTYNALSDAFEAMQEQLSELSPLRGEIARIQQEAQEKVEEAERAADMRAMQAEGKVIQAENAHSALVSDFTTAQLALTNMTRDFATYRRKYPERMAAEIQSKDNEISQMRADRKKESAMKQELQRKLNVADKEVGNERRMRGEVSDELFKATALYNSLKERVEFHDGREDVQQYLLQTKDGCGDIGCYIYNFHFGLSVFHGVKDVSIETANFHYQIRTAMMLAMDVVPGIWGNPVFQLLPQLVDIWDTAINDDLHARIMARIQLDYPKLHQRILDGKAAPLTELIIPAKTINLLQKAGYETVADVGGELPGELLKIKGLGEQSITDIKAAVNSWCITWSRTHGDIENIKSNRVVRRKYQPENSANKK